MIYLGIDPGASGGIACIDDDGLISTTKIPDTERDVWDAIRVFGTAAFAVIEKVGAFPGQGVSSCFAFGRSYGFLRACLVAAEIPFEEVQPRAWQKAIGVVKRGRHESKTVFKNRLKALSQQLFPAEKVTLATADAILLAEFARRTFRARAGK